MVTSDTHEALFGCNHLGGISKFRVALCVSFLFLLHAMLCLLCLFVPPVGFLCIFTRLLTCPCMNLATSVSSMFQHNEVMDIRSKPTFVPRGHHLLFAFLLVCLFTCLLSFLFLCLSYISCLSALCLFHMLFASFPSIACLWFLSLSLHIHRWSEDA